MTRQEANRILDKFKDGQPIPQHMIEIALLETEDYGQHGIGIYEAIGSAGMESAIRQEGQGIRPQ